MLKNLMLYTNATGSTINPPSRGRIVDLMGLVSRNVVTIKARVRALVHPSVCQSVRWFVSDGFVMLPPFDDIWPWSYGHGSGVIFTTVPRQFSGCGPKGKMTIGTITYRERPEEEENEEDSLWSLPLLLLQITR